MLLSMCACLHSKLLLLLLTTHISATQKALSYLYIWLKCHLFPKVSPNYFLPSTQRDMTFIFLPNHLSFGVPFLRQIPHSTLHDEYIIFSYPSLVDKFLRKQVSGLIYSPNEYRALPCFHL